MKAEIKRKNGNIEIVDISAKFPEMCQGIFNKIKEASAKQGDELVKIVQTVRKSNGQEIIRNYKNLHNEGKDGYVPDDAWIRSQPEYKSWEEEVVWS
jgi:hypothetical protein